MDELGKARANIGRFEIHNASVIHGDVETFDLNFIDSKYRHKDTIVAANLPYLPTDQKLPQDPHVDGGVDGLRLIPSSLLRFADHLGSDRLVLNVSSLADVDTLLEKLWQARFGITSVVATVATLEQYSFSRLGHIKEQPWSKWGLFGDSKSSDEYLRQIIYGFTFLRNGGVRGRLVLREAPNILHPARRRLGSIFQATAGWEI
jgi:hypothetical protein